MRNSGSHPFPACIGMLQPAAADQVLPYEYQASYHPWAYELSLEWMLHQPEAKK